MAQLRAVSFNGPDLPLGALWVGSFHDIAEEERLPL